MKYQFEFRRRLTFRFSKAVVAKMSLAFISVETNAVQPRYVVTKMRTNS